MGAQEIELDDHGIVGVLQGMDLVALIGEGSPRRRVFSREVGVGQVVAKDFLDGRVIMCRGASGRVTVLSAYCRHLGADLSLGTVIGDDIRGAFHHWPIT